MTVKKIIAPVLIAFLTVLYILSFLLSFRGEKKYPEMETALLNSQYKESLSEIQISSKNSAIILENKGDFWEGRAVSNGDSCSMDYIFPADTSIVERNVERLQKIIKIQKVSDNKKRLSNFGLDDENAVRISYSVKNGVTGDFSVGKTDFSQRARYIVLQNYEGIFKTDLDFGELLYTAARQWYDPYIIPRSLFQSGDEILHARIQKDSSRFVYTPKNSESDRRLLELRHGSLGTWQEREVEMTIVFEMTSGELLTLDFAHADDDVVVRTRLANLDFEYCYHISEWTYKNILETVL